MAEKLNAEQTVNVYCNVRGVHLTAADREALAALIAESYRAGYETGVLEMAPYRQAYEHHRNILEQWTTHSIACPQRHEAAEALAKVDDMLQSHCISVNCDHEWKDATNEVVHNGEICLKCGAIRPTLTGEHTQ